MKCYIWVSGISDNIHFKPTKIVIMGAGYVGSTLAYSLMINGIASEIVLIDIDKDKTKGEAMDLDHGTSFINPSIVKAGGYLAKIFREFRADHFAYSKVIWDISAIAYLINSQWVETEIVHSPILTDLMSWSVDRSRHFIRSATVIRRDPIFRDFYKIKKC